MKICIAALAAVVALGAASVAFADGAQDMGAGAMNRGGPFDFKGGQAIFTNVCQGCHMPDAMGATGAGTYPSLAANKNLESGAYPVFMVLNGRRGMPAFADMMTDGQVAAVVNYLRTHFGNEFQDAVTAKDVQDARR